MEDRGSGCEAVELASAAERSVPSLTMTHMSPENRLDFIHGIAVNIFMSSVTKAGEGSFQNCKIYKIMLPFCEHKTQHGVERPQHLVAQKMSVHKAHRNFHKNKIRPL